MGRETRPLCRVIVLGSTGSIGTQTLEVIEHLNALYARGIWQTRYQVVGLAAGSNVESLREQARRLGVAHTRSGSEEAERLVREVECDLVVAAISGIAGLGATLAAVELGRDVALANKETLVAAGAVVVPAAKRSGARLLPVDSEHSGVWQCLGGRHEGTEARRHGGGAPPMDVGEDVKRIVLTASGGPFRTWTRERMEKASIEDALRHPTWNMGKKVTIDSASLMNKVLEIVEAHWLFGLPGSRIGVLVHPQSIVHAMVEFTDGSTVTQMGAPDMRTPIQYALTWPRRAEACSRKVSAGATLEFEEPDLERFPGLALAYRALDEGGTSGAVMNAANERAVGAFLAGKIAFGRIPELARAAMDDVRVRAVCCVADVMQADQEARRAVDEMI